MSQPAVELLLGALWPIVQGAILGTIPLAVISFALGLVIALGIALMRLSRRTWLSGIARGYISIVRGTPL
ncbi:MAG: cysteine transporter permease, partial [Cryobacterium sp.]|nr:cysteine transporter permease [Cryobacterium sp.]